MHCGVHDYVRAQEKIQFGCSSLIEKYFLIFSIGIYIVLTKRLINSNSVIFTARFF